MLGQVATMGKVPKQVANEHPCVHVQLSRVGMILFGTTE